MATRPETLGARFTQAQRRAVAELLPELADRLMLDEKNPRTLTFTPSELETIQKRAETAIPGADTVMRRNTLRHVIEAARRAIEGARGAAAIPEAERLYQFKITLLGTDPPVWRRIQVKNCTLDELHEHIQTAMDWTNSHLHQFEINGRRYADPQLFAEMFLEFNYGNSTVTKVSEFVPQGRKQVRLRYQYDFGDDWHHEVRFEGCFRAEEGQRYPLCLDGARACPPEDIGGVWGYDEFLEARANPNHEAHEDYVEWIGDFDPEEFDAAKATDAMRRGLPDWR